MRTAPADCGLGDGQIQSYVSDSDFNVVASLEVNGRLFQTWQEATERAVRAPSFDLGELVARPQSLTFGFPASREVEPLRDEASGRVVGSSSAAAGGRRRHRGLRRARRCERVQTQRAHTEHDPVGRRGVEEPRRSVDALASSRPTRS